MTYHSIHILDVLKDRSAALICNVFPDVIFFLDTVCHVAASRFRE